MGNPFFEQRDGAFVNTEKMCYNAAKTFQLASTVGLPELTSWYNRTYDTLELDLSSRLEQTHQFKLVGLADYYNNPNELPIVVKIYTGSVYSQFIAFNKASGINADNTLLCGDCVTVIFGGTGFKQSWNLKDPEGGLANPGEQVSERRTTMSIKFLPFESPIFFQNFASLCCSLSMSIGVQKVEVPTMPRSLSPM